MTRADELAAMSPTELGSEMSSVANRVAKWRGAFTSWQLGTRSADDPECLAIRDHREMSIFMRAEINAVTKILIDVGIIDPRVLTIQTIIELEHLDEAYMARFPGFSAHDDGLHMDLPESLETLKRFPP